MRHFIVYFRNSVFIDSDRYAYDRSDNLTKNASISIVTTRARRKSKNLKQLCFKCNEQRECDINSYNIGVLGRCKSERSKAKLQDRMRQFLQDKEDKFHEVATRLQMKISFEVHDFYAADVYHSSSYIKIAIKKKVTISKDKQIENLQNDILEEFLFNLKERVILKKVAFEMKIKTLLTLPPDPNSMEQAIRRTHHQLYYWLRFETKEIGVINIERESGAVTPVWFKGTFFHVRTCAYQVVRNVSFSENFAYAING